MPRTRSMRCAASLLLLLCLPACNRSGAPPNGQPHSQIDRLEIYSRAGERFDRAYLLRPDDADADLPAFALAPLLMFELRDGDTEPTTTRPFVWFDRQTRGAAGRDHETVSYLWWQPAPGDGAARVQGVRMTLDDAGFPLLWEVLRDGSGARVVVVSSELEDAIVDDGDAAELVVARAIEPGPMPLGPFVYLRGETGDVLTVLCRCMPSQVDEVVGGGAYRLRPLAELLPSLGGDPWNALPWAGERLL